MATDIAEFLGAALGLNLLFGVPLFTAGLITGVIAFGILELQRRGVRRFELAITALLGIVFAGFLYETLRIGPSAHQSLDGLIPGARRQLISVSRGRDHRRDRDAARDLPAFGADERPDAGPQRRASAGVVLRFERIDVIIALGLAGVINLAMLVVAAKLFHTPALSRPQHDPGRPPRVRRGSSAAAPRSPSRSRCSPRAPRRRASAPTPGRS